MSKSQAEKLRVSDTIAVSTLWQVPRGATACYVLAHGAGAGMTHPFMESVASALAARNIATLRFQFPYMERGSKRPDPPKLCHATVRAAVALAREQIGLPLIAGGRSFGGRMASQAQAADPLPGVVGLAFLGFPLHPPKAPADERAEHLQDTTIPLLFLQGTRDELADLTLVTSLAKRLGKRATLELFEDADHSFHVRARSGRTDAQVFEQMMSDLVNWIDNIC
ncbi:MAG: alpha/beta fold hydrolase [Proteobacteria bacterium]|nr:alpha/beta fold hydrolase [Pseudomonadota bacterium]